MREIKFRVWNTISKEMTYFDTPYFTCMDEPKIGFENVHCKKIMIGSYTEPMQFTGLKDRNGKLIYEGDLLSNGIHHPGEVIFRDACFYVGPFRCELYKFAGSQKEVIGNIYENPELLGGDK